MMSHVVIRGRARVGRQEETLTMGKEGGRAVAVIEEGIHQVHPIEIVLAHCSRSTSHQTHLRTEHRSCPPEVAVAQ